MNRNRIIGTVILALTVGIVIGAVILGVRIFSGRDFNPVFETGGDYRPNGFLYVSSDGEKALYYRVRAREGSNDPARTYISYDLQSVDLAVYGFEGKLEYFDAEGFAVTPRAEYEGVWPVSVPKRLIYLNGDEKWCLDTERKRAYPVFADSVEGVDPCAKDVLAFSSGGIFAMAFDGKTATVYVSDDDGESMKIAEVKTKDLSGYGDSLRFHAFVNERAAFFSGIKDGKPTFFAIDCGTMNVAVAPLKDAEYGDLISRVYLERRIEPDEKNRKIGWTNCLLGTEYTVALSRAEYEDAEILSVSSGGTYAILRAETTDGGEEILVAGNGKVHSFTAKEPDCEVLDLTFSFDNIILAVLRQPDGTVISRGYKICY